MTAEQLTFKVALLPLLEKRIVLSEMALKRPVINISRDSSGKFNISDLLDAAKVIACQCHAN